MAGRGGGPVFRLPRARRSESGAGLKGGDRVAGAMTARPVLLATDLSDGSTRAAHALPHVADPGAEVRVLHVVGFPPYGGALGMPDVQTLEAAYAGAAEAAEGEVRAWAARAGLGEARVRVVRGDAPRAIAEEARAADASLVALGSQGLGRVERALLGSVARATVRRAHGRDVLVAKAGGALPPRRVLVATDFGATSARAARRGAALAGRHGAEILLAHVVDPAAWPVVGPASAAKGAVERALAEQNARDLGGKARVLALHGRPAVELAEAARAHDADLVVVGSHGAGPIERAFLGSVAEGVVERSSVSVLVVTAPDA